jgi:hypothetical protein
MNNSLWLIEILLNIDCLIKNLMVQVNCLRRAVKADRISTFLIIYSRNKLAELLMRSRRRNVSNLTRCCSFYILMQIENTLTNLL